MRSPVALACAVLLAASACDKPPVDWRDPVELPQPTGAASLVVDSTGAARLLPHPSLPVTLPAEPGLCRTTAVTTVGTTSLLAAWWRVRADSSAALEIGSSPDSGKTWRTPIAVDTTDVASTGCHRPPPSLTTVGDDVYVAYSMIAPEGKGVFFAHTMSGMLHSPVPVIYGDRLVATAIAADANHVAVAYEEPNGSRAQVAVALSASQGHLFEIHTTASRSVDNATAPGVAFDGPVLAVSWLSTGLNDGKGTRMVRVGRILPWK